MFTQNPQLDPSNSPTGDADLISYLQAQNQQGAATPQVSAPAAVAPTPQDPMEALRKKLAEEASRFPSGDSSSILRQKLGLEDEKGKKITRGPLGTFGNAAGNILQILAGRNFSNEAAKDYQEKLQGMKQGESLLKNDELSAYRDEVNRLKQADIDRRTQETTDRLALEKQKFELAKSAQDFTNSLKSSQGALAAAKAHVAEVEAKTKGNTEGLTGPIAQAYLIAKKLTDGTMTPEMAQLMLGVQGAQAEASQQGKQIRSGATRTQKEDANGNIVTNTSTLFSKQPGAQQNAIQRLLGIQGQSVATPPFIPPNDKSRPSPSSTVAKPQVAPQQTTFVPIEEKFDPAGNYFQPSKTGNILADRQMNSSNIQSRKKIQDQYNLKAQSFEENARQRSAFADAYIKGKAAGFQGFLPSALKPIRDTLTGVGIPEGFQRSYDFRALYDNLSSNMKGAFKKQEIDDAKNVQSSGRMSPESALVLHTVNELTQQAQAADMGKWFVGPGGKQLVSQEVITKLMNDAAAKYINTVYDLKKQAKTNPAILGIDPPALPKLTDLVNQYLMKKQIGIVPKTKNTVSPDLDPEIIDLITKKP